MATISTVFTEFNPTAKTKEWFHRLLGELMNKKQWLISKNRYDLNQSFAEGNYSIEYARKKYDIFNIKADELFIDFQPLDLFGGRVTSITSILEKMGFSAIANTVDPTARSKRDADIDLLKAEAEIAPMAQKFGQALGMKQPLPVSKPEDFSSDISPIKKLNLDINNPIDEGIFKDFLQRQIWEVALEVGMQHYLNINEYNEKFKLIVADLINDNCASMQVVVNSYSGEPQLMYIYPYNAYTVIAKQPDGKDALGKGWEQPLEVRKIIGIMGKDITMDDLAQLLSLATANGGNTNYDGIWMYGSHADPTSGFAYPYGTPRERCCDWQAFLNLRVTLGYLEIKSQNSDLYVHSLDNGNLNTVKQSYDYNPPKNIHKVDSIDALKKDSDRYLEYKFYDVTYKGYYIPNSNLVFGFGKLPLAVRYGTTNELTDYSIVTYKIKGKSMNEKAQPYIKHIFDLWCKIQHWINESKGSGEMWNSDTVRLIAKEIVGTDGKQGKTLDVLKILKNLTNGIYVPQTINGEQTGGDSMPVHWQERGLEKTVTDLYGLIMQDKNFIVEITGVSDILLASSNPSGDQGLGVSQIALQQSLNTIYYIQSAVQKMFSDVCFNFSQKIQWIANGDVTAEAFKSLSQAIGDRNVQAIKLLGTNPPYTFAIDISWGMNEIQRQEIKQQTNIMLQSKVITSAQAFQINDIKNYKLAAALLSLYEAKNMQQQMQSAQANMEAPIQLEQMKHKNKMEEIALTNKGTNDVATTNGSFSVEVEKIKAGVKIDTTNTKEISKHITNDMKHQQNIHTTLLNDTLDKSNTSMEQQHEVNMANMNQQPIQQQ